MSTVSQLILPPHSVEAEQSILGGLLLVNSSYERVSGLSEHHFYRDDHRRIFRHIVKLIEQAKPADVVTVFESLEKSNEAEQCGGLAYLGDLARNTPSAANIHRYAEIVRDRATARRMLNVSREIGALAMDQATPLSERVERANHLAAGIAEADVAEERPLAEVLGRAVGLIQERYEAGKQAGLPIGLTDLDSRTGGLQRGDLIIVAGRTSSGKTAFALNIAERAALAGHAILIGSFEMSDEQIGLRLLSQSGRIPMPAMRTGQMSVEDFDRLTMALGMLHDAPIDLFEASAPTTQALHTAAKRVRRRRGRLDLVIVDYLQLMTGQGENRTQEIADISRRLKWMAKELNVPVIALSQLSRKVDERANKRPMLSDLRESGAIEQDADLILLIHREEMYSPGSVYDGTAEIIIGKNRNGPTGDVRVAFLAESTRFEDLAMTFVRPVTQERRRGYKP